MAENEEVICDFTTGICGPAGSTAEDGVMEFIDLTAKEEETIEE